MAAHLSPSLLVSPVFPGYALVCGQNRISYPFARRRSRETGIAKEKITEASLQGFFNLLGRRLSNHVKFTCSDMRKPYGFRTENAIEIALALPFLGETPRFLLIVRHHERLRLRHLADQHQKYQLWLESPS